MPTRMPNILAPLPMVILEDGGERRKIFLRSTDLPNSRAYMDFGGGVRTSKTWYPGSQEPTVQILGPEEGPLEFGGVFNDHLFQATGHATALVSLIDRVRKSGHPVVITYGPFMRRCVWKDARFRVMDITRIGYKLRFEIIRTGIGTKRRISQVLDIPGVDAAANAAESLSGLLGALPKGLGNAQIEAAIQAANNVVNSIAGAGSVLEVLGEFGKVISPNSAKLALNNLDEASTDTKAVNDALVQLDYTAIAGTNFSSLTNGGLQASQAFGANLSVAREIFSIRPRVASLANETNQNTVYVASQDDTLQSISHSFYGDAGRWPELVKSNGLTSTHVTPGDQLKIPGVRPSA